MSIGPAFALYLVGTDPSTNLYVGLALVGFAGLVIALNARYESKWQTLPSSSAYRIKMETRLELDSKDGQAPSSTTVTTSETINSEKYPEGDQVSKRTLRDSFNIFEPRALPGAIPQMIMCVFCQIEVVQNGVSIQSEKAAGFSPVERKDPPPLLFGFYPIRAWVRLYDSPSNLIILP